MWWQWVSWASSASFSSLIPSVDGSRGSVEGVCRFSASNAMRVAAHRGAMARPATHPTPHDDSSPSKDCM